MKLKIIGAVLVPLLGFLMSGCTSGADQVETAKEVVQEVTIIPPSKIRLDQICRSYINNDFRGLIGMMHNYKDKPVAYQQQLIYMLKQRAQDRSRDSLKILQILPNQIITQSEKKIADVYMDISYSNGKEEEIILPMIYDNGNWWIK